MASADDFSRNICCRNVTLHNFEQTLNSYNVVSIFHATMLR